jgi:hypothetical protein
MSDDDLLLFIYLFAILTRPTYIRMYVYVFVMSYLAADGVINDYRY